MVRGCDGEGLPPEGFARKGVKMPPSRLVLEAFKLLCGELGGGGGEGEGGHCSRLVHDGGACSPAASCASAEGPGGVSALLRLQAESASTPPSREQG